MVPLHPTLNASPTVIEVIGVVFQHLTHVEASRDTIVVIACRRPKVNVLNAAAAKYVLTDGHGTGIRDRKQVVRPAFDRDRNQVHCRGDSRDRDGHTSRRESSSISRGCRT